MAMWDEGWLPPGWHRGNPIYMINPYFKAGAMAALELSYLNLDAIIIPDELPVLVQFHYDERPRVLAWLRWFFDVDASPTGRDWFYWLTNQIR